MLSVTVDPTLPAATRVLTEIRCGGCGALLFAFTHPRDTAATRAQARQQVHGHACGRPCEPESAGV